MIQHITETIMLDLGDNRLATIFVRIWAPEGQPRGTVFCIHGYTGNGSDFAYLAQFLARTGYKVVCPDMLGRGKSSYLRDSSQYNFELFVRNLGALERYAGDNNIFIGSSWGGLITLIFLRMTKTQCSKLILNDVYLKSSDNLDAMREIISADSEMTFADRREARDYLLRSRPYLADLPADQFDHYLENKIVAEGPALRLAYDPALPASMAAHRDRAFDFYPLLAKTGTFTLLLYGRNSPLIDEERLHALTAANPLVQSVTDIQAGHPPSLMRLSEALLISGYVGLEIGGAS